jgi:hypothetical protein
MSAESSSPFNMNYNSKFPFDNINSPKQYNNSNKLTVGGHQYGRSMSFNHRGNFHNNNNNNQDQPRMAVNSYQGGQHNSRFNQQQQQQNNGYTLYIKADNVSEDLLRSIFNANVSNVKIVSIDIKNK